VTRIEGPASPEIAAGWHPDPVGGHELRYWDGAIWTDHVSDDGVETTGPLDQSPSLSGQEAHTATNTNVGGTGKRPFYLNKAWWLAGVAVVAVLVIVAATRGGSDHAATATVPGGATAVNVAAFCRDYITVVQDYQATSTVEGDDLTLLAKAQAEAPDAVKKDVTAMLTAAVTAAKATSPTFVDLSTPSQRVSTWANSNCLAGTGNEFSS